MAKHTHFGNWIGQLQIGKAKYHFRINAKKKALLPVVSCSLLLSSFLKLLHSEITMLKTINSVEIQIKGQK